MTVQIENVRTALNKFLAGAEQVGRSHLRIFGEDDILVHLGQPIALQDPRSHLLPGHYPETGDRYRLHYLCVRDLATDYIQPHIGRKTRLDGALLLEAGVVLSERGVVTLENGLLRVHDYPRSLRYHHAELNYQIYPRSPRAYLDRVKKSDGSAAKSHGGYPKRISWTETLAAVLSGDPRIRRGSPVIGVD